MAIRSANRHRCGTLQELPQSDKNEVRAMGQADPLGLFLSSSDADEQVPHKQEEAVISRDIVWAPSGARAVIVHCTSSLG